MTVEVTGQPASVSGVRRLLYEIMFNLCDNAIKYNTDGGRVEVEVTRDGGTAAVTVRDTGIGIPPEPRVRAVLPGGQEPLQGLRRHGTGPVHREARRAVSPRHHPAQKRGGEGHGDPRHVPCGIRKAARPAGAPLLPSCRQMTRGC